MRIRELLENTEYMDSNFGQKEKANNEPDFDVLDDLVFFMHNDDDTYRRQLHPIILKCIDAVKQKKKLNSSIFADAVRNGYKHYLANYSIQELPDELDEKQVKEVCKKLSDDVYIHISNGKYKD